MIRGLGCSSCYWLLAEIVAVECSGEARGVDAVGVAETGDCVCDSEYVAAGVG